MAFAEHIAELAALGRERRHQHTKAFLGGMAGHHCKRLGELWLVSVARGNDNTLAGLDQRLARAALVEDRKFGRHSRLQWEAAQQRLAEGVNRRDLDAARGFENAREKPPRAGDRCVAGHAPGQFLQGLGERPRPQSCPIGQLLVQPVCHLGSSSAREGEAQDASGIRPVEHQPQQTVDQHPRLAGSGRGGDPDGSPRAGGLALRGVGVVERPHSSASLSASRSRCR